MAEEAHEGEVEAYEQDWYRSLKALAEHQERIEQAGPQDQERAAGDPGDLLTMEGGHAPSEPGASPFSQQSPEGRRRALEEAAERGLTDELLPSVRDLLLDPDPEIRTLCLRALATRPSDVDHDTVSRALLDPEDRVRAAAVYLAAAMSAPKLTELVPLLSITSPPESRRAAFTVLPTLIRRPAGLGPEGSELLYSTVADLDPLAEASDPAGLAEIARAIGLDRLVELASDAGVPAHRRIGAAHLLLAEGSSVALQAVAGLTADEDERIRAAGTRAGERASAPPAAPRVPHLVVPPAGEDAAAATDPTRPLTTPAAPPGAPSTSATGHTQAPGVPVEPGTSGVERAAGSEMIAALARTLHDPDDGVRNRARRTLVELNRDSVLAWARDALTAGGPEDAVLASWVAERVLLAELAPELLHRGSDPTVEDRGPFVDALSSFSLGAETLHNLLEGAEASRRATAIRLLWHAASRAVLPALRPHLVDADDAVRAVALEILGESADPGTIEAAERAFGADPSASVRIAALGVIAGADGHRRLASLEQALRDPDPDVRLAALRTLPRDLGEDADALLLQALADPEKRAATVTALMECVPERVEQLALARIRSLDPEERLLAVDVVGRLGTDSGTRAALETLQDPSVDVRKAAAHALAALRDPATVNALGAALRDPESSIRIEAVRALGVIDHEGVLSFLVSALSDPDPAIRRTASEVMTTWSSPAVARRLAGVLANPDLRQQAEDLLTRMGPSATELLVDVALHGDTGVRAVAGQLLSNISGLERFLERLSSVHPDQRLRALEALGVIGGPDAVTGMTRAVSDPDPRVRQRAIELLGSLGDPGAIEAVERAVHGDPVPEVAAAAVEALRRLRGEVA